MFVRNCGYVAAWDHELLADTLLERTLLGESVLFYRRSDGSPVAIDNRCPRRHAPLSMGRKEGDAVRCLYHGLKYDSSGQRVEIAGRRVADPRRLLAEAPRVALPPRATCTTTPTTG